MDPIVTGAMVKIGQSGQKIADSAAAETGGLLRRLLGPSADVIGEDWADRLRRRNLARLLEKTEGHATAGTDPGWAQPRVAAAVFDAAQYSNDEIVTDYLSGVLASARAPEGGSDDALPWSSLVSRLSALQLRLHYVLYRNFRQIAQSGDDNKRMFDLPSLSVAFPADEVIAAVGLDTDGADFHRLGDALQGMKQEDLFSGYAYGNREFFTTRHGNRDKKIVFMPSKHFEPPFDNVLQIDFTPFGVHFFLWGMGFGQASDLEYMDPAREFLIDPSDNPLPADLIEGVGFTDSYWVADEETDGSLQPTTL